MVSYSDDGKLRGLVLAMEGGSSHAGEPVAGLGRRREREEEEERKDNGGESVGLFLELEVREVMAQARSRW